MYKIDKHEIPISVKDAAEKLFMRVDSKTGKQRIYRFVEALSVAITESEGIEGRTINDIKYIQFYLPVSRLYDIEFLIHSKINTRNRILDFIDGKNADKVSNSLRINSTLNARKAYMLSLYNDIRKCNEIYGYDMYSVETKIKELVDKDCMDALNFKNRIDNILYCIMLPNNLLDMAKNIIMLLCEKRTQIYMYAEEYAKAYDKMFDNEENIPNLEYHGVFIEKANMLMSAYREFKEASSKLKKIIRIEKDLRELGFDKID